MSNKGKHLTDFEQGQVIALEQQKMSNRAIAKRLERTEGTIRYFLKKYDEIGAPGRREGSGRPRATTEREDRRIVRSVKCDRRTSVKVIREETELEHLSLSTIKRRIREGGFFGGWSNKKPTKMTVKHSEKNYGVGLFLCLWGWSFAQGLRHHGPCAVQANPHSSLAPKCSKPLWVQRLALPARQRPQTQIKTCHGLP